MSEPPEQSPEPPAAKKIRLAVNQKMITKPNPLISRKTFSLENSEDKLATAIEEPKNPATETIKNEPNLEKITRSLPPSVASSSKIQDKMKSMPQLTVCLSRVAMNKNANIHKDGNYQNTKILKGK